MSPVAQQIHDRARALVDAGSPPVALHLGLVSAETVLGEMMAFLDFDRAALAPHSVARYGELDVYVWTDAPGDLALVSLHRTWRAACDDDARG